MLIHVYCLSYGVKAYLPDRFDLWCTSHQLWHICIVAAVSLRPPTPTIQVCTFTPFALNRSLNCSFSVCINPPPPHTGPPLLMLAHDQVVVWLHGCLEWHQVLHTEQCSIFDH